MTFMDNKKKLMLRTDEKKVSQSLLSPVFLYFDRAETITGASRIIANY